MVFSLKSKVKYPDVNFYSHRGDMSITPLSAARIAGEVGLAGGTVAGGSYAVKYGQALGKYEVKEIKARGTNHEIMLAVPRLKSQWNMLEDCMDVHKKPWESCKGIQLEVNSKFQKLEDLMIEKNQE